MITLSLPWPPPQLFPNFKRAHHWSKYRKQCNAARTLGWGETIVAMRNRGERHEVTDDNDKLKIYIVAAPPMRGGRVPDEDGLKGALKHYLDGIARAIELDDSHFRFAEMEWEPKEGAGAITISF